MQLRSVEDLRFDDHDQRIDIHPATDLFNTDKSATLWTANLGNGTRTARWVAAPM